jgi:hypothetical protein
MVLVVASDHLPKPCTNLPDTIMLPAEKLDLDGLELRNHSLFRRNPPDGEGVGLVPSPAVVGEAQEREGLRFPFASLFPFVDRIAPELDQSGLFRVEFQAELRQPFLELFEEPHCFGSMLEAHHKIVGITNDDDIAPLLLSCARHPPIGRTRSGDTRWRATVRPLLLAAYPASFPTTGHPPIPQL